MKEHLDEATLQAYADGELSAQAATRAGEHFAACARCVSALDAITEEMRQFHLCFDDANLPVPTESLRHRINLAIAEQSAPVIKRAKTRPMRSLVESLVAFLSFDLAARRRVYAAIASVAVVALLAAAFLYVERGQGGDAPQTTARVRDDARLIESASPTISNNAPPTVNTGEESAPPRTTRATRGEVRPSLARSTPPNRRALAATPRDDRRAKASALIPGERSYLETITNLTGVIENDGNAPLNPSLQTEYQRSLAIVDRAIAETRLAAQDNPNDTETARLLYAAYQSKIDLLSAVAVRARD